MGIYDKFRDRILTGDIILFSGKGNISASIKWLTKSKWSHVGLAIKIESLDLVLCLESTTLVDVPDFEKGTPIKGVQITNLSDRLNKYDGQVAARSLVDVKRDIMFYRILEDFKTENRNKPYEQNYIELFKSAYDGPFGGNKEDLSSLFCSELVAELYQRWGLLPEQPASNEYTPNDFSEGKGLKLLKGKLTEEILLKE